MTDLNLPVPVNPGKHTQENVLILDELHDAPFLQGLL